MEVLPTLTIQSYDQIRHQIRSGDILLCSGNSVFSNMIKQATHSAWSHVAFILRLDVIDRIMVLESVESIGVRTVPLSSYVEDYDGTGQSYPGKLMIARHEDVQSKNIPNLSKIAVDLLGHRYHNEEIARIASRITLHSIGMQLNNFDAPNCREFICSEYAYICFRSIGVTIDFNPLGFISPSDFAQCQKVKPLFNLATAKELSAIS